MQRVTPSENWSDSAKRRKFSQRFSVLGWTDTVCDAVLDTTTTWDDFADSLIKKFVRRKYISKNDKSSSNNNVNLIDLDNNYSTSIPSSANNVGSFSTPNINNVALDQNTISMQDHAMYQYYINTVVNEGWRVEPQLWKALPDKVKRMVMEAKREVFKNGKPPMESFFANQSKPSSNTPQKNVNITDSILKSKKNTPTP